MAKPRLLITYAHPDDESFGLGGLIAKYVAADIEVYLICATNGEAGTVSPEHMNGHDSIADLRLSELDCASALLGFTEVYKLGYRDSGMMNTADNDNPASLWFQWQNNRDTVLTKVVNIIREVRPHVIITFNEYGGYGHPDHIAIQQATVAAMEVVNDTSFVTSCPPYQPQKLYYSSLPRFIMRYRVWLTVLQGKNPRKSGRNADIDMVKILENANPATTYVDIKDYFDDWEAASACHASQGGGGFIRQMPKPARDILFAKQGFTLVQPENSLPKGRRESDLFERVVVD
jgi:LmbE family N-acetylglucosaminyl deacetylase